MADEVPKWLVAAYRKHLKREAAKEMEFRGRLEVAVTTYRLADSIAKFKRAPLNLRQSSWTAWVARNIRSWASQGYDDRTIGQLLKENLQRAMATAARRGEGAMAYHRQRQDGGFL